MRHFILWLLFGAAMFFVFVFAAVLPPVRVDSLVYHLEVPRQYLQHGGVVELPWNIYSYFPGLMEYLYWGAMACGVQNPQLLHALFGCGCCGLVALIGQRYLGLRGWSVWVAVFGLLLVPEFFKEMTWAYVDLANAFFWLAGIAAFFEWKRRQCRGWWVLLAGAMAAGACSVKYTSLIYPFILGLLFVWAMRRDVGRRLRFDVAWLSAMSVLFLLLTSWWWVRNWMWTGNPLFPFFDGLFVSNHPVWTSERIGLFNLFVNDYGGAGDASPFMRFLLAPLLFLTVWPALAERFDGVYSGWLLFGFLSLVFWVKGWFSKRGDENGNLTNDESIVLDEGSAPVAFSNWGCVWVVILIQLLFWIFSSQQVRFALVLAPFFALTAAGALQQVYTKNRIMGHRFLVVFLLLQALNAVVLVDYFVSNHCVSGLFPSDKTTYLKKRLLYYDMYVYINENTPVDSVIGMVLCGSQTYYLERKFDTESLFDSHILRQMLLRSDTPQQVIQCMHERQWDYLLLNLQSIHQPIWLEKEKHELLHQLFTKYLHPTHFSNGFALYDLSVVAPDSF